MIEFQNAKQYLSYHGFRFLKTSGPYYIVYLSETSNFKKDKNRLNFFYLDFKDIIIKNTIFPRTYLTGELIQDLRENSNLIAHKKIKDVKYKNIIYEPNIYFNEIDKTYDEYDTYIGHKNGKLIYNKINQAFNQTPKNFKSILLYSVIINECHKEYNKRKFFLFYEDLKNNHFNFDNLLMCLIYPNKTQYRILIKNKQFNWNRIYQYIRYLK